ncbi:MAG: hypothetical protein ACREJB_14395 [Planctomycetaceae bacterium]
MVNLLPRRGTRDGHAGVADFETSVPLTVQPALSQMQRYAELTGLGFLCVDPASLAVYGAAGPSLVPYIPEDLPQRLGDPSQPQTVEYASGLTYYSLPLPVVERRRLIAAGYLLSQAGCQPSELVLAAVEQDWSERRLKWWLLRQKSCPVELLRRLLHMACALVERDETTPGPQERQAGADP